MIAIIALIIAGGSLVVSGFSLYFSWRQKQERILVKLVEEKKDIFVNEVSMDSSDNFNIGIVSIGRKYIFSLTNVTSESIFITKIYYKDPKTHSLKDSNLCTSITPLELSPKKSIEVTMSLPLYVSEEAGRLISFHALKEDYARKHFKNIGIERSLLGYLEDCIFIKVYINKYSGNFDQSIKQHMEELNLEMEKIINILNKRIENIIIPQVQMNHLIESPKFTDNAGMIIFNLEGNSKLFQSLIDVELSNFFFQALDEGKIQKKDFIPQFDDYRIIFQTSKNILFYKNLKSKDAFLSLTVEN